MSWPGRGRPRESASSLKPRFLAQALEGPSKPCAILLHIGQQIGAHRHRHFGGRRRRRRADIGGEIDQGGIRLVPHGGDQRNGAGRGRAHHDLLVEGPEVFQAAAAARDDQQIGPRHPSARLNGVEAGDGRGDLFLGAFALHQHRPDQHMAGKAVTQAMQDVADHGAAGRGDDADDLGQEGQRPLARDIEQAFAGELLAALLQQLQQRALARQFDTVDDELIGRAAGIAGDAPGGDDLQPVFRGDCQTLGGHAPAHPIQLRFLILEREIEMAAGRALEAADFAPHPHAFEIAFQGAFDRLADLADGEFGKIAEVVGHCPAILCCRPESSKERTVAQNGDGLMRILVVGGGGREHALCWSIAASPLCEALFAAPGNAGIAEQAQCVPIAADDLGRLVDFAREQRIDFVVVGPEGPLVLGLADRLAEAGIPAFGPSAKAAALEGSKGFMKDLCRRHGIPTARYARFTEAAARHGTMYGKRLCRSW